MSWGRWRTSSEWSAGLRAPADDSQSHHQVRTTGTATELAVGCRRLKIERLFAWLQNFRRLVTHYERHAENFLACVQLGCIIILARQFVR